MSLEDDKATAQAGADDAFDAAFEGKPEEPRQPATETPPEPEPEAPRYVQITEQEWADMKAAAAKTASYDKQFSTVFGTVGRFEKLVKELQQQVPKGDGATVKLTTAAFDKLKEQFPELADMTREAVQNALVDLRKSPEIDKSEFDRIRKERLEAEMEALEDAHSNWRELIGAAAPGEADPEHPFRKWLAAQPQAYQDRVNKTESAAVILRAIDRYQADTKPKPKPTPRAHARREQIASNVQPRGDGAPPPPRQTVDDAFEAAFRS